MKEHHVHILSVRSTEVDSHSPLPPTEAVSELRKAAPERATSIAESAKALALASSIPGVPVPGYYPVDLSNPGNGTVVTTAKSHSLCGYICNGYIRRRASEEPRNEPGAEEYSKRRFGSST